MESILFVPYTPQSVFKQRISKLEEGLPFEVRYKIVEEVVATVASRLCRKDPYPAECDQGVCPIRQLQESVPGLE